MNAVHASHTCSQVLGGISTREKVALLHCRERVGFAYARLCRLCVERKINGGLPVGEPVLSRVYQVSTLGAGLWCKAMRALDGVVV